MPSDPSYGTTGFFSYLWTKRTPVYDDSQAAPVLVDEVFANILVAEDGITELVPENFLLIGQLVRWV